MSLPVRKLPLVVLPKKFMEPEREFLWKVDTRGTVAIIMIHIALAMVTSSSTSGD